VASDASGLLAQRFTEVEGPSRALQSATAQESTFAKRRFGSCITEVEPGSFPEPEGDGCVVVVPFAFRSEEEGQEDGTEAEGQGGGPPVGR